MLETIVQDHERLSSFPSVCRDVGKICPQYRRFQAQVVGLVIYLGSRNRARLRTRYNLSLFGSLKTA